MTDKEFETISLECSVAWLELIQAERVFNKKRAIWFGRHQKLQNERRRRSMYAELKAEGKAI